MEDDKSVSLKPQSRVSSETNLKDLEFVDSVVLEIRRALNKANIHRVSSKRPEGYVHSVQNHNNEPILYFNVQSKKGNKTQIARDIYKVLTSERGKYDVDFTGSGSGVKVFLRRTIVAKKIEKVSYNPFKDDDVLLQSVLDKSHEFQYMLLSKMDPKIFLGFIEKMMK